MKFKDQSAMRQYWNTRQHEINWLLSLFGEAEDEVPPILVHGPSGTGKTQLLQDVLSTLRLPHAFVACAECYSPRILYEAIESQLAQRGVHAYTDAVSSSSNSNPTPAPPYSAMVPVATRASNLPDFISSMRERCGDCTTYIVLDEADCLLRLCASATAAQSANLLAVLLRMGSVTSKNICTIMCVESANMSALLPSIDSMQPLQLAFRCYSSSELRQILCDEYRPADWPNLEPDLDTDGVNAGSTQPAASSQICNARKLFEALVRHVLTVFQHTCGQDLRELRHVTRRLFPVFVQPVSQGIVDAHDTRKLLKLLEPHMRHAQKWLFHHDNTGVDAHMDTGAVKGHGVRSGGIGIDGAACNPLRELARDITCKAAELPWCTKFLLVAAFIASFNPADADMRYFSTAKKKKKTGIKRKRVVCSNKAIAVSQHHLGPRPFPLERLLAIFHSLVIEAGQAEGDMGEPVEIHSEIASLVRLNLLARISSSTAVWDLDQVKLRCLAGFSYVDSIARNISVDLSRYLFEQPEAWL